MKIKEKLKQLYSHSKSFIAFQIIIVLMIAGTFFIQKIVKMQEAQISQVRSKMALIAQIPDFQKKLQVRKIVKKVELPLSNPAKKPLIFRGVAFVDREIIVLINDGIYRQGDKIEDYSIAKVTEELVFFKNNVTKGEKYIYYNE